MATMLEINRRLADQLYAETRQNSQSPYAGKKVGFANGQVVVVADGWSEVARALEKAEPDAQRTYCIDMAQDYTAIQEIWEIR